MTLLRKLMIITLVLGGAVTAAAQTVNWSIVVSATAPTPTSITPVSASTPVTTISGTVLVPAFTVGMSDGSTFAGTIIDTDPTCPGTGCLTQISGTGASTTLVAGSNYNSSLAGAHTITLQACQSGQCNAPATFTLTITSAPTPASIAPLSANMPPTTPAGTVIVSSFAVTMSDNSTFTGTITDVDPTCPGTSCLTQITGTGAASQLIAGSAYNSGESGPHTLTLQPCQGGACLTPPATFTLTIAPIGAPKPISISPLGVTAADNTISGTTLVPSFTVGMSDGSTFAGTITDTDPTCTGGPNCLTQIFTSGSVIGLKAGSTYNSTQDGNHPITLQACQSSQCYSASFVLAITSSAGIALGPTVISNSVFNGVAGNANAYIGDLFTFSMPSGVALPQYSLLTTCGAACADSSKFNITSVPRGSDWVTTQPPLTGTIDVNRGQSLTVGTSDLVCPTTTTYHITVRDNDLENPGVNNVQYDQPFNITCGPVVGSGSPQWQIMGTTDCLFNGTSTSAQCSPRWTKTFTGDSVIVFVKSSVSAPSGVTITNNAATCTPIAGAAASTPTGTGLYYTPFLCPNVTLPASIFNVTWPVAAGSQEVVLTEVYGCTAPCVAEAGNNSAALMTTGTTSLSTTGPTTAANDLIISSLTPNNVLNYAVGPCCTSLFVYGNNYTKGEYQIGATAQSYTNNFVVGTTNGTVTALQTIFGLKRNAAPPVANPASVGQKAFTVYDNVTSGAAVAGSPLSAITVDRSPFLGTFAMPTNPGGLLNLNTATGALTINTANPTDGTYSGQVSATQNGVTVSQNITLYVIPQLTGTATSNCPTTPPPEALRAGYTVLGYCMDGAAARYATSTNWLRCDNTWAPGVEWYAGYNAVCQNDWSQVVDPVSGKTVLQHHWHSTDDVNSMYAQNPSTNYVIKYNMGSQLYGLPVTTPYFDMPSGYYSELKARFYPVLTDTLSSIPPPDYFTWGTCPDHTTKNCNGPPSANNLWSIKENDFIEFYGPRLGYGGNVVHDWYNGCCNAIANNEMMYISDAASLVPGWTGIDTQVHRYGNLKTTDGATTSRFAEYIDDVIMAHVPYSPGNANPFDQPLLPTQTPMGYDERNDLEHRQYLTFWTGGTWGLNTHACQTQPACVAIGGDPDKFDNIEYWAVWVAPDQTNNTGLGNGLTR